jgi:hypothetical protein
MAFLLALCLAVLDAAFPCRGTIGPREPDPAVLASLVEGRVLLCLVRNGMTLEQVELILGKGRVHSLAGCLSRFEAEYDPYGICVEYDLPGKQVIGRSVYCPSQLPRPRGATWGEVGKVAERLKGRVLGSLVRKGMTQKQAEQLLGRGSKPFPSRFCIGPIHGVGNMPYYDLGLWVEYCDDGDGVLLVDKVGFSSLFD